MTARTGEVRSTMEQICEAIQHYRQFPTYKSILPVIVFKTIMGGDGIYLMEHDFHCYVAVLLLDYPKFIITDGTNNVCVDMKVRNELKEVLNTPKTPDARVYHNQTKADHCARSKFSSLLSSCACTEETISVSFLRINAAQLSHQHG